MPIKLPHPGYVQKRPTYPAVRNLWRLAKEQDSCLQAAQISMLFLENFIKTYNLDRSDFVKKLSELFHVSVGHHDWDTTKKIMALSYIVQTYNIQELFFKDLIREYCIYKKVSNWQYSTKTSGSTKSLDPYAQLIHNLDAKASSYFAETPEAKIIQYYRLIRNAVVHSSESGFQDARQFYSKEILPNIKHFHAYFKFPVDEKYPAPNAPADVNYYDSFIYSRSLRYLSFLVNDACNLNAAEILEEELKIPEFRQSLTYYNHTQGETVKAKLDKKLFSHFKTHYGTNPDDQKEYCLAYYAWYENHHKVVKKTKMKRK